MFRRSSHSVWDCRYHLVWATKRRRRAFRREEERAYCERLLRRVAEKYDMHIVAMEVAEEHVHVCAEIPPQISVGKAVRMYKSLSARYMVKRFPHLKKYFWGGRMWSPSYFVRTAGEGVTAETVKKYIEMHDERIELGPVQAKLFRKGKAKRRT
jgi:putative transposase